MIIKYSLILFILSFIAGCDSKTGNADKMISGAKALDQKFVDAYNNRDVNGVMETYWKNPELVSYPPGVTEEKGWNNVKKGIQQFFGSVKEIDLKLTEMNYKISGDNVISWGLWTMQLPDGNGGKVKLSGRFTDIKAKRNGKWVYILDHASVPLPPPES